MISPAVFKPPVYSCFGFFFQMKVSFQNTKQTLFCLQVRVFRGRCLHQLQHLFTSKKKRPQCSQAVLSTAQAFVKGVGI